MILLFQLLVWNCNSWCFHASSMPFESAVVRLASRRSRPQSLLGAWARRPGGSGDTGFEVLDFRTSGYFWFKSKLEDSILKALNRLNLQSLTRLQEQVNAIRTVVENQKWPEVLKSRTSNPVSPEPPGPCAQAPRGLWGRKGLHVAILNLPLLGPRLRTVPNKVGPIWSKNFQAW